MQISYERCNARKLNFFNDCKNQKWQQLSIIKAGIDGDTVSGWDVDIGLQFIIE